MKNIQKPKQYNSFSKFHNKPLVASKTNKKTEKMPHYNNRKHYNDDDDFDVFDDEDLGNEYGNFKNFERMNRRVEKWILNH